MTELVSIAGRSSTDVWLLSESDEVAHVTGTSARRAPKLHCAEPYHVAGATELAATFHFIDVSNSSVTVHGDIARYERGVVPGTYSAKLTGGGWKCKAGGYGWMNAAARVDKTSWKRICQAPGDGASCSLAVEGADVPVPEEMRTYEISHWSWSLLSPTEAWLAQSTEKRARLWEYNGVSWYSRPVPFAALIDISATAEGKVWGLAAAKAAEELGREIVVWDAPTERWSSIAVPDGFAATRVVAVDEKHAWFVGGETWFEWDGSGLREIRAPFPDARDVWLSPDADLWVVGGSARAVGDERISHAAAVRLVAKEPK